MVFDLIYEPSKAKTSVRISNSKRVKQSGDETSARADRGKVGGEMVTVLIGVVKVIALGEEEMVKDLLFIVQK